MLTLLVYRGGTLHSSHPSSLFLLFLFLRGPSSSSFVRRPSSNLAPVLSSARARGLVFFALYFSPSRLFYPLPKSIPIRQRLHGGSTAGTGPSRKDSLKRQPTPATLMPVAAAVAATTVDLQLRFNLAGYTLNSSRLSNSLWSPGPGSLTLRTLGHKHKI